MRTDWALTVYPYGEGGTASWGVVVSASLGVASWGGGVGWSEPLWKHKPSPIVRMRSVITCTPHFDFIHIQCSLPGWTVFDICFNVIYYASLGSFPVA